MKRDWSAALKRGMARLRKQDARVARGYRRYRGTRPPVRWFLWLLWAALLCAAAAGIWLISHQSQAAGALLRGLAQHTAACISRITGVLPVPINEWLIGLALGLVLYRLIRGLWKKQWAALGRGFCRVIFFAALAVFLFMALFMVQHSAPPLAQRMGLTVEQYTQAQLEEYCDYAVEQVNRLAEQVPRKEDGECDFGAFRPLSRLVSAEYETLAAAEPVFDAPRPGLVKRSLLGGRIMSLVDLAGYYFPWTGESIVSSDVVDTHIPFNIAHERAHALGIGPEAECNFAAWLALKGSQDLRLQYSAWFNAYIYASNALYSQDPEASRARAQALCSAAKQDIRVLNASLARFTGPLQQAGSAINNAYIKSTGQPEGVRSYGRVVDLLLAYHFAGQP